MRDGDFAVKIFIVLSGFLLMSPAARDAQKSLGSLRKYFIRRAKRILPGYYASLLLSSLGVIVFELIASHYKLKSFQFPQITPFQFFAHLIMVHNFFPATAFTINGPLWSVATEAQLYVLFPLVLLICLRKLGRLWTLIIADIIAAAVGYLPMLHLGLSWYYPEMINCFTFGMIGADVVFSNDRNAIWMREKIPFGAIGGGVSFCSMLFIWILPENSSWIPPLLFAAGVACLIVSGTLDSLNQQKSSKNLVCKVFETPMLVSAAAFSYSLYLIHDPILVLIGEIVLKLPFSPVEKIYGLFFASCIIVTPLAYGFSRLFEKPFIDNRNIKTAKS